MNSNQKIILAVVCLLLSGLACKTATGTGSNAQKTILSDDFSSTGWGTATDQDSSIQYSDQALRMVVYKTNWFIFSTPNKKNYQNVHIEVTVINHGTDETTSFGILCDQKPGTDTFYYFGITPAGQYAIVKSAQDQSDVFLTGENQWTVSEAIQKNAAAYRVGADCGNGTLVLYVDGQQIASVSDTSYSSGSVGLFTWSGEAATTTDVSFDDFLVTDLGEK